MKGLARLLRFVVTMADKLRWKINCSFVFKFLFLGKLRLLNCKLSLRFKEHALCCSTFFVNDLPQSCVNLTSLPLTGLVGPLIKYLFSGQVYLARILDVTLEWTHESTSSLERNYRKKLSNGHFV